MRHPHNPKEIGENFSSASGNTDGGDSTTPRTNVKRRAGNFSFFLRNLSERPRKDRRRNKRSARLSMPLTTAPRGIDKVRQPPTQQFVRPRQPCGSTGGASGTRRKHWRSQWHPARERAGVRGKCDKTHEVIVRRHLTAPRT
jgi:hypothetical protein